MAQTEARRTLRDAPIMWRRINSIGVILDCNSTYAARLGYSKPEVVGRPVFEHVPKESWQAMNDSLRAWFETGRVADRRITFLCRGGATFPGLLQASSLYDAAGELVGSNTVILDLSDMGPARTAEIGGYIAGAAQRLDDIGRTEYGSMDKESRSEYDGLREMFGMLSRVDLGSLGSAGP